LLDGFRHQLTTIQDTGSLTTSDKYIVGYNKIKVNAKFLALKNPNR